MSGLYLFGGFLFLQISLNISYTLVILVNMETVAKPKKWGNSIGVIIPKEIIEQQNITLGDELVLHIEKKKDKEKAKLMKEGYIEMKEELARINKEWKVADKWPS